MMNYYHDVQYILPLYSVVQTVITINYNSNRKNKQGCLHETITKSFYYKLYYFFLFHHYKK